MADSSYVNVTYVYLFSPTFQFMNISGKPLADGYIEVYISGKRSKYYAYSDFDGTLHPFQIPLNALGSAVVLVSPANSYDVYVYNSLGVLQMSRYNITPATGDVTIITYDTTLTSNDDTVDITSNSSNEYDLSIATKINELKEYTDQAKNDAIESANTSIADLDDRKKDKQNELIFNGSATKTVKKITQNTNGNLNVEFEDINISQVRDISNDFTFINGFSPVQGFKVYYYPILRQVMFRGQLARSSTLRFNDWVSCLKYIGTEIDFQSCSVIGYNFGVSTPQGGSEPSIGCLFAFINPTTQFNYFHFAIKQYVSGNNYGIGFGTIVYLAN